MIDLAVLGPIELRVAGRPAALGGPGRRAVLAALALGLGDVVSLDRLVDTVWDDAPPATAVTKLQGHICALRNAVRRLGGPPDAVETRAPGYRLRPDLVRTDLARFSELLASAAERPAAGRALLLGDALALWRGLPFADVRAAGIQRAAVRIAQRRTAAVEDLAAARIELGLRGPALDDLRALIGQDPYRERAWELIIRAHLELGEPAAALAAYDELHQLLRSDLGIEPGAPIRELVGPLQRRAAAQRLPAVGQPASRHRRPGSAHSRIGS